MVRPLTFPTRIVSGIRPTNAPMHLGHYFGAMRTHIELQHQFPGKCFYFVADLHAVGSHASESPTHSTRDVARGTLQIATVYLALGLNPRKAWLYRQSAVESTSFLAMLLAPFTPSRFLTRNPVLRSKNATTASVLSYRLLMAADILGMQATVVPVGPDQQGNVETAQEISKRLNTEIGEPLLPLPQMSTTTPTLILGCDGSKMRSGTNQIDLFPSSPDRLTRQVKSIKTDSKRRHETKEPETCTIMSLYQLVAPPQQVEEMAADYRSGAMDYATAKLRLRNELQSFFGRYESAYRYWSSRPDDVVDILDEGTSIAKESFQEVIEQISSRIGLNDLLECAVHQKPSAKENERDAEHYAPSAG